MHHHSFHLVLFLDTMIQVDNVKFLDICQPTKLVQSCFESQVPTRMLSSEINLVHHKVSLPVEVLLISSGFGISNLVVNVEWMKKVKCA